MLCKLASRDADDLIEGAEHSLALWEVDGLLDLDGGSASIRSREHNDVRSLLVVIPAAYTVYLTVPTLDVRGRKPLRRSPHLLHRPVWNARYLGSHRVCWSIYRTVADGRHA